MIAGFNPSFLEPPLSFNAEVTSRANPASTFDGMDGVLDPRKRYQATLSIPFQTGKTAITTTIT